MGSTSASVAKRIASTCNISSAFNLLTNAWHHGSPFSPVVDHALIHGVIYFEGINIQINKYIHITFLKVVGGWLLAQGTQRHTKLGISNFDAWFASLGVVQALDAWKMEEDPSKEVGSDKGRSTHCFFCSQAFLLQDP